jgi:hypothetical protein
MESGASADALVAGLQKIDDSRRPVDANDGRSRP